MATNDNPNIDVKAAAQQRFPQSLADANDVRLSGLTNLMHLAQGHIDSIKQDQARIGAKYGPDAKQTRAAAQALAVAQARFPQIQAELLRTKIEAPKADPNAAIVYGRILDKTYAGVAGALLTVAGNALAGAPRQLEARTNADGEFVLSLPPQDGTPTLDFEVLDQKGFVTKIADTFSSLHGGTVTYREYVVQPQQG
jgi:hypothetical protein